LNLKLKATYDFPNVENPSQNRAFKTSAKELYLISDTVVMVVEDFQKLIGEEAEYAVKGSGYALQHIDGLPLSAYMYLGRLSSTPTTQQIPMFCQLFGRTYLKWWDETYSAAHRYCCRSDPLIYEIFDKQHRCIGVIRWR
jgi:hypothetical protein